MKISEVAKRSGVPTSTLRYYERLDLLTPGRSANGYRTFNQSHLERLEFIDAAKQLGLELPEIRRLLQLADTGTCSGVKAALGPLLAEQSTDVEHRLDTLTRLRSHLREAHEHVAACPDSDEQCRSECAFRVLTRTAQEGDRNERWRALLAGASITSTGDALRIRLPADRASEAVALIQAERGAASFGLALDATACTITAAGTDLDQIISARPPSQ